MTKPARRPPKGTPAWIGQGEWVLAGLLTAGALALHVLFFRNVGGIWRDEVNSLSFARMPLADAYHNLRFDSFPLLTTVLLRAWIHVAGASDVALRSYGLLVGILFLTALWFTGRMFGPGPPLIPLALVGLNPWVVRTTDSIRPYGWGLVLIVGTLGCVWKAVETEKPKWLLLTGILAVASVQCMYQSSFLLFAIGAAGAIVAWRASKRKTALYILAIGALAAVSILPYLPVIRAAGAWGDLIRTAIPFRRILNVLSETLGAGGLAFLLVWGVLALAALAAAVPRLRTRGPSLPVFCAIGLVLTVGVYLAALVATHVQTEPWYYVPIAALAAPLIDGALRGRIKDGVARVARIVIVLAVAVALAAPAAALASIRCTNMDLLAARLEREAGPEDLIVMNPFWIGMTFQHDYRGKTPWMTIPPMGDLSIVRYDRFKEQMARPDPNRPVLDAMTRTLQGGHRVYWVECMYTGGGVPKQLPPAPLPGTGWFLGPYLVAWGREGEYHLESHGLKGDVLAFSEGVNVISYEQAVATVVTGWR